MTHTRLQLGGAFSTSTQTIALLPVISAFVGLYKDAEAAALRAHSWSGSVRNLTEAARAWAQCRPHPCNRPISSVCGATRVPLYLADQHGKFRTAALCNPAC